VFYLKKYFFVLFLLFSFGLKNFLVATPNDSTKANTLIKNSGGFKPESGSVIKTSKWLFPIITITGGISYFYFDSQASQYYQKYKDANSIQEANDFRAKTKSNEQFATISGVSALIATAISIFAWIYDTKSEEFDIGEEYKFTLTFGRQITGRLVREDFDSLLVQTKDGVITIKRSDIARIESAGILIYEKQ
jgi:hypothetical protein